MCLSVQLWCRSVVTCGDRGVSALSPRKLPGAGYLQEMLLSGPFELFGLHTHTLSPKLRRAGMSPARAAGMCLPRCCCCGRDVVTLTICTLLVVLLL